MSRHDNYERLCRFYELLGTIRDRDAFKEALQQTVSSEDLDVFFLLPKTGNISLSKLQKTSRMPGDALLAKLKWLAAEGFIWAYQVKGEYVYERSNFVFMTEQQVRKKEQSPQRTLFARFFATLIEGETAEALSTKTPYYRVLPAEPAINASSSLRTLEMDVEVPDPSGTLPIDIITEMVRKDRSLIGVAECFCRKARRIVGKGCDYPLDSCFVFNEAAQTLIENGFARKIDFDEAVEILKECEALGLVHNVDNCEGQIRSLCNCCPCCCVVMRSVMRGETNAGAPSRYVVDFSPEKCDGCEVCLSRCPVGAWAVVHGEAVVDTARCIGCGLCVTACPAGAIRMVLREKATKIPKSLPRLHSKLGREVMFAYVKRKLLG
jgi:NAD-dependent dihydropyrimidine dehydrogenase PreA subunit